MIVTYPTLYHKDAKGKVRVWYMERSHNKVRTVSGIMNGQLVVSEWKTIAPKRKKSPDEQAAFHIDSQYENKTSRKYHRDIKNIDEAVKFDPMLAATYKGFPGPGYVQPKLDGYRCLISKAGVLSPNGTLSRGGLQFHAVPHILEELIPFFEAHPDVYLDGELYNHDLKDDFEKIGVVQTGKKGSVITPEDYARSKELVQYHVYDCVLTEAGDASFRYRLWFLDNQLGADQTYFKRVKTLYAESETSLEEINGEWLVDGYEGLIWRNPEGVYQNKRTKDLQKYKEFEDAEFPVISVNEGQGNWAGYAKSLTCLAPNGKTFNCGIRGNRLKMRELLHGPIPKEVTVRMQNITMAGSGKPRMGVAIKIWINGRDE